VCSIPNPIKLLLQQYPECGSQMGTHFLNYHSVFIMLVEQYSFLHELLYMKQIAREMMTKLLLLVVVRENYMDQLETKKVIQ
jgi:hypothetical protein